MILFRILLQKQSDLGLHCLHTNSTVFKVGFIGVSSYEIISYTVVCTENLLGSILFNSADNLC